MKFEDILSNTKLTYFIIYIFIVLGSLVTLFCKSNNYIIFLLGILLLPNSCLILTIIYDKKLKIVAIYYYTTCDILIPSK